MKVLDVDRERRRIALSARSDDAAAPSEKRALRPAAPEERRERKAPRERAVPDTFSNNPFAQALGRPGPPRGQRS